MVADFETLPAEEHFAELVALADHPVVSLGFAQRWTGQNIRPKQPRHCGAIDGRRSR